jgi:hypothetical protein
MNSFAETQHANPQRVDDPNRIVRQWSQSRFIYEGDDSKGKRTANPEYHPPICQRADGKFCDVEGRLLPLSKIPAYVQEEGKTLLKPTAAPVGGEISLADAMRGAAALSEVAEPTKKRTRKAK